MPKELCHWMIAREAGQSTGDSAAPRTLQSLRACPEAFLLGAVAFDGPFYVPKDARMAAIGAKLHGHGAEDAYAPIKRAIATIPGDAHPLSPAAIAFAAGALSHIAADVVFHPAVFYFTGFATHSNADVRASCVFRHRAFEAAMDLHLLREHGTGIDCKVSDLVDRVHAGREARETIAAVARFYAADGQAVSEEEADHVLCQDGKTQKLFWSRIVRGIARILSLGRAGRNEDTSALFYASSGRWNSCLASPRPFLDPVSGVPGVFSLPEFFDRAVALASSLFPCLDRSLDGDAHAFAYPGPSLESGHSLNEDQTMKHCDPAITGVQR
jgi:hypothetical protein